MRPDLSPTAAGPTERVARLEGRAIRERRARIEAEGLLEAKSRELYDTNEKLRRLAGELEERVEERTRQLSEAHQRAVELVERDLLTNLANRARFARVAEQMLQDAEASGTRVAFVSIDVDRFKEINDSLGHEVGDVVLQYVATQFETAVRSTDLIARLGGDEFCAVFPDLGEASEAGMLIKRMRQALEQPLHHRGRQIFVETSMGYALFPDHGDNLDELLRHADVALYRSKAAGRGVCTAFDRRMGEELQARHTLERELRLALAEGGLVPWFQPIIDTETGLPCGAEALVRWQRSPGQILPPGAFISVIEECGLMPQLFEAVLGATLEFARPLIEADILRYVTVNVSPTQFKFDTLPEQVLAALTAAEFPARGLVLEITEEVLLTDFERASQQLNRLAASGIRFALDDFGNGYANIGYLRRLPLQKLKLDRLLTADVGTDSKAFAIVAAVAKLADALDLSLIAEGIESEEQADALRLAGCRYLQGFNFARPMPREAFLSYLRMAYLGPGIQSDQQDVRCGA